jgi:hypothetical protein
LAIVRIPVKTVSTVYRLNNRESSMRNRTIPRRKVAPETYREAGLS